MVDFANLSIASEKLLCIPSQIVTNRSICFCLPDLEDVAAVDIDGESVAPLDPDGSGDEDNGDGDSWGGEGGSGEIFDGDDDIESENDYFEFMYVD